MTWLGIDFFFTQVRSALDFGSSQPGSPSPRANPTTPTPSEWPLSDVDNLDAGSDDDHMSQEDNAFVRDEQEPPPEDEINSSPVLDTTQIEPSSSHPPAPTPAQRWNPNFE